MKIIIVDDDCLVAGALKTILEVNEDVEVLATGADGKEACELYERYEPDVLHPASSHAWFRLFQNSYSPHIILTLLYLYSQVYCIP